MSRTLVPPVCARKVKLPPTSQTSLPAFLPPGGWTDFTSHYINFAVATLAAPDLLGGGDSKAAPCASVGWGLMPGDCCSPPVSVLILKLCCRFFSFLKSKNLCLCARVILLNSGKLTLSLLLVFMLICEYLTHLTACVQTCQWSILGQSMQTSPNTTGKLFCPNFLVTQTGWFIQKSGCRG